MIVRQQYASNTYNIRAWGWWDGGRLMMLPSREEGGAVADLLIVRRRQQGQWILPMLLMPAILDVGLGKSSKRVV